ncbi:MAG TPA: hypothetical protein VNT58_12310 [Gaiellaceae bacterium]|nr:hypothetical protein [Gaiellaceae bacterium]
MTGIESTHERLVEVVLRLRAEGSPIVGGDADEFARRALRRWLRTAYADGERGTTERRLEDLALALAQTFVPHPPPPLSEYRHVAARLGEVLTEVEALREAA